MALYEATTMEVLTTGLYRWQLDHPTPWTQRVMPGFRVAQRGICDVQLGLQPIQKPFGNTVADRRT